ncbi:MAG: type II toxin-antitoxin system MqsA family antitoxin [Nitrospiraceae bacterium]
MYDYGKCHVCSGKIRPQRISQDFWIRNRLIVIEDVPAGVCPQCGEKVVKAEVGRRLAAVIEDTKGMRKARAMSVPVIQFKEGVA